MDHKIIGEKIRNIREKELKITREQFAEEIGISIITLSRLENASQNVTNIEIFIKIAQITGYSLEHLLELEKPKQINKKITRINYFLTVLNEKELNYIVDFINRYIKFHCHSNIRTLKEIKKEINN